MQSNDLAVAPTRLDALFLNLKSQHCPHIQAKKTRLRKQTPADLVQTLKSLSAELETHSESHFCGQCFEKLARLKLIEEEAQILKRELLESWSLGGRSEPKSCFGTLKKYFQSTETVFIQTVEEIGGVLKFSDLTEIKVEGKFSSTTFLSHYLFLFL